jgi:dihydrofolate synthase/folylpolyglutamate synthase
MTQRALADWLSYLEQLHPSAIDMGLLRVQQVATQLGLKRPAPLVITVTGTNGKGSTCAFLESLLMTQGLKVGVYSSPHLLRYNERVRIAGVDAADEQLCAAFAEVELARLGVSLTYFEMGTLAAFWLFQRAALDAVILEVGLGGRLDAVNLLDADLALVTSIGLDHAEWLGNTRESVAFEKAGIFRPAKPVLCGDLDPPLPLLERVAELDCPLFCRGRDYDLALDGQTWQWRGLTALGEVLRLEHLPVLDLPLENAALAIQAYALLDLPWQPRRIADALVATRVIGRLDRRVLHWQGKTLTLLLDVGHNPHAAEYLAQSLAARPIQGKRLAVFGLLADKDLLGVINPLRDEIHSWAVVNLPTERSRSAEQINEALVALGAMSQPYADIAVGVQAQCAQATEDDEIVLFGSFYCVAQALEWLAGGAAQEAGNGFAR